MEATRTMIARVEDKFDIKPERLVGDTAYGSAAILNWLVDEKHIEPHVPVMDKTERQDGTLSSNDFEWDHEANQYRCPAGKILLCDRRPFKNARTHITKADTIIYRASEHDCSVCPLKVRCCPNTSRRKIARSIHEDARNVARRIAKTEAYEQSRKDRKKVEVLFGHLKRILKLDRLRLRGFSGAKDEFLMAATVQNLRRMAMWLTTKAPEANLIPA